MLSTFRRGGVVQLFVGAIVAAIIVVFVMTGTAGPQGSLSNECAVEVGDSCISLKEYDAALGLIVDPRLSAKQIKQLDLRRQVLEGLLERELLLQQAERLGLAVSEDVVNENLREGRTHVSLPAAVSEQLAVSLALCTPSISGGCEPGTDAIRVLPVKKNGTFNIDLYNRIVRATTNRSPKEFKAMQQRELTAARLRDLVRARVRVSEDEAFSIYQRERSRVTVRSVQARRDWFARYGVALDAAAVDDWAIDNKEAVDKEWTSEKASFSADCPLVQEILVRPEPGATDAEKAAAKEQLVKARATIKNEADFARVAREISDAESAVHGGHIGCLTEAHGPSAGELLKALTKVEPGSLSNVVETAEGYYLLRYEGKLEEPQLEAVGRRQVARRLAARAKGEELARAYVEAVIEAVEAGTELDAAVAQQNRIAAERGGVSTGAKDPATWPALTSEFAPKVEISAPFNQLSSPLRNALPTEQVASKAFGIEKVDAVHDEPIQTLDGFALIQLKEKDLVSRKDFQDDKRDLIERLRRAKAREAIENYVARLRASKSETIKLNANLLQDPDQNESEPGES